MSNIKRDRKRWRDREREIERNKAYFFFLLWYFEGLRLTGLNL